jgi:hypothetical protein
MRRIQRLLTRNLALILFLLFVCLCAYPTCVTVEAVDRTLRRVGILPVREPTPVPVETPTALDPGSEPAIVWKP